MNHQKGIAPIIIILFIIVLIGGGTGYYLYKDSQERLSVEKEAEKTAEEESMDKGVPITDCLDITGPGNYYLANDIRATEGGSCIAIEADNVILDCQNKAITGSGEQTMWGITLGSASNFTIKNCIIKNFSSGIHFYYSNNGTVSSNTVTGNKNVDFLCSESSTNIDGRGNICESNPNCSWLTCSSPTGEVGCVAKFYLVGQQITGLKGKDGKLYQVVVGDVVASSGVEEYEIILELYEQDSLLSVDSDVFVAGDKADFGLLATQIRVKEIYKFETSYEPGKVSIEICPSEE